MRFVEHLQRCSDAIQAITDTGLNPVRIFLSGSLLLSEESWNIIGNNWSARELAKPEL